ncbi:MAG TPA: response regulator transcription factor [Candidatus Angelobacter sp.]|nr:response regulator transcription factor [Candidatus Angelobacter sp.]
MVRTPPLHVIVADDHALIRELLERQLKELDADVRVYHAGTLQQVLEFARTAERLDLILLDLRMPGMNGFAGLQAVRQKRPEVPVAILSGQIDPQTIREALQAGAAGYLPKTMRAAGMLNALRLILAGERYVPESALNTSAAVVGGEAAGVAEFSKRERDVIKQLMLGHTNKEIARDLQIEEVTVALHLRSIYRKLVVRNRTQAVRLLLERGWES